MATAIRSFGGGLLGVAYIEILAGQNGDTWWNLNEITLTTASSAAMPFRIDWLNTVTGINNTYCVTITNQVQTSTRTDTDIGGTPPPLSFLTDGNSTTGIQVNGAGFQGITTARIRLARPDNLLNFSLVNCIDLLAPRMWNCRVTVYSLNNTILDQFTLPSSIWVRNTAGFWSYSKSYTTIMPIPSPLQISGCQLWLDGNDQSTLSLSGSNVTQWRDKSTASNTYTNNGTVVYQNGGLYFAGASCLENTSLTGFPFGADPAISVFVVFTPVNTSATQAFFAYGNVTCSQTGYVLYVDTDSRLYGTLYCGALNVNTPITVNTTNLVSDVITYTGTSGSLTRAGWLNGSTMATPTASTTGVSLTTSGFARVGASGGTGPAYFSTGFVYEVVFYNRTLTTTERQQVEGYLALKWGLQGRLPANHPFKTAPVLPQLRMSNLVPVSQTSVFLGTGSIQTFTVPAGVYAIRFFLWGAGGIGQGGGNFQAVGGGAYVEGNLSTSPGTQYSIIVGRAGQSGLANGGGTTVGSGGGGFSGIFSASPAANTVIAIAGGGGGSGYNANGFGGGGGFPTGSAAIGSGSQGGGGTQTAGGSSLVTAGSQLAGGNGGAGDGGGGGGGGGWYGGGGGTGQGGGGGGSSTYLSSIFNVVTANGGTGQNTVPTATSAGGTNSPFWISPYGNGGQNGLVVIGYTQAPILSTIDTTFSYTGADQSYTVPTGVTLLIVRMWGAGGGGNGSGKGGGGAYVEGRLTVTPGESLTLIVGSGGSRYDTANNYGGGGGSATVRAAGGQGGGRSAIRRSGTEVVTAGGGGGGSSDGGWCGGAATVDSQSFAGDITAGVLQVQTTALQGGSGGGGSTTAGGVNGDWPYPRGSAAQFQGGTGSGDAAGGGGGGGYWGGGGGGYAGGGGGGSSYLVNLTNTTNSSSANRETPGNSSSPLRGTAGQGGTNVAGGNGLLILSIPMFGGSLTSINFAPPSFRTAVTFSYTAANQTFTVPPGIFFIAVYMWGGGGGGGGRDASQTGGGGAGAMVQGVLRVRAGEPLTIVVGGGGSTGSTVYGGGGRGSGVGGGTSGGGGGRSAIVRSGADVVVAGGGGGGSYNATQGGSATFSGTGADGSGGTTGGKGGTQSAGGAAGSGSVFGSPATPGSQGQGGGGSGFGGGGGGGWYGGGGGSSDLGAGGGGGSSYTSLLILVPGQSVFGFTSPDGKTAPNTTSPYYVSGVAAGGNKSGSGDAGGNGLVVIAY
jgi:hypothetical protein